jgi:ABC-type sugar transport system ATPase subunit
VAELSLEGVSKTYPTGLVAVRDSLTVTDAELMVLVGPSARGKSTILRMISGRR